MQAAISTVISAAWQAETEAAATSRRLQHAQSPRPELEVSHYSTS